MKKFALSGLLMLAVASPMSFANSESAIAAKLPPAAVVDADMDMEDTMESMKKAFKKLGRAKSIENMQEPAKNLALYTSQSVVIAQNSEGKKRDDLVKGLKRLRIKIAELQAAIDSKDLKAAKTKVKEINRQRKRAHKYFDV